MEFLTVRKIRQVGRPDGTENFDKSGKVISLTKVQRDEMNAKKLNKNLISPRKSANAAHADKSTDIRRLSAVQAQYIKKGYLMWLASLQELGTPV